jgi:hypothetical protein
VDIRIIAKNLRNPIILISILVSQFLAVASKFGYSIYPRAAERVSLQHDSAGFKLNRVDEQENHVYCI